MAFYLINSLFLVLQLDSNYDISKEKDNYSLINH